MRRGATGKRFDFRSIKLRQRVKEPDERILVLTNEARAAKLAYTNIRSDIYGCSPISGHIRIV